jgi:hypothetical protein
MSAEKVATTEKTIASTVHTPATLAQNTKREVYYTPESALQIIEPYIKDFKCIWDPASGIEHQPVKDYFESKGHRVVVSDIYMGTDNDFLTCKTKKRYDIIITTPPYSLRKDFIKRAIELRKPFAFLVPLNVLDSKTIRGFVKEYKISLIFPQDTVNFYSPDDSKSVKQLPYSIWIIGGVARLPDLVI